MKALQSSLAAAILIGGMQLAAAQQQRRPQTETTKVEGTDNVYIFRNGNHQAMFIVTGGGRDRYRSRRLWAPHCGLWGRGT